MIIKYTTKQDINGNRYTLSVDHDRRTYKPDYNTARNYDDYITITKRDRRKLINILEEANYTSI